MRASKLLTILVLSVFLAISVTSLWQFASGGQGSSATIIIYGFSAIEEPMNDEVVPAFQEWYRQTYGEEIRVVTSFAGSGTIFNQIRFGAPAQIAIFATELEPQILKEEGLITTDWTTLPNDGTFAYTTAVIVSHAGDSKGVRSFQDLARPGIKTIVPDPTTSGGAQWAILSIFGSVYLQDGDAATSQSAEQAAALVTDIRNTAVSLPDSARQALIQFALGYGDLLLTYENEALMDIARGRDYELIVPRNTIIIEPKAVIIDANVPERDRSSVEDFMEFLWSPEAQEIFAEYHFRVTNGEIARRHEDNFPQINRSFTVDDLGGWEWVTDAVIDGAWRNGSLPTLEEGE